MTVDNPYKPAEIKLESRKRLLWLISLIGCGIYSIVVFLIVFTLPIPIVVKLITIYSYMVIGPLTIYLLWLVFYRWKTSKWPQSEKTFGERTSYTLLILLIGINVITWAAYWNSGLDSIWYIGAYWIYDLTGDDLLAEVVYRVGARAITPAFTEEFLKSFPSIIAFFIVLQRDRDPDRKRKGLLGNELGGFLFGLIIGITFEIIELIYYLAITFLSGGGAFNIYLQVTVRNWAPIHILGGAVGGFAAGRAERLRFERGEEDSPMKTQILNFIKRFTPLWLIPVSMHFLWNSSSVWIFLIVMAVNGGMVLYLVLEIVVIVTLSVLCFILLAIFLRRANRIAEKTIRCPETGFIVAKEGIVCSSFSEKYNVEPAEIPPDKSMIKQRTDLFCRNCGKELLSGAKFCTNCGFQPSQLKTSQIYISLYDKATKNLLIVSIIASILFLILIIVSSVLVLFEYGIFGLVYIALQTSVELVGVGLMIYAIITLSKLRNNYEGKKSIWGWHLLIFNLIGIFGLFLIFGIVYVIYGAIALTLGYISFGMLFGILFLIGATIIFIFLLIAILNSKQMFHYQRFY